jgi:hypothetical protein
VLTGRLSGLLAQVHRVEGAVFEASDLGGEAPNEIGWLNKPTVERKLSSVSAASRPPKLQQCDRVEQASAGKKTVRYSAYRPSRLLLSAVLSRSSWAISNSKHSFKGSRKDDESPNNSEAHRPCVD